MEKKEEFIIRAKREIDKKLCNLKEELSWSKVIKEKAQ